MPVRRGNPESHLLAAVRLALGREPGLVLWRNATGMAARDGKSLRFGLVVGGSDLVGILWTPPRPGRWFCLEVKTLTGRCTPEQTLFLQLVRNHGGFATVVRSVAAAEAALHRAREGADQ